MALGASVRRLRQLTHLVAIAEERQFTRTAARLYVVQYVVQSTLAASISGLERPLGTGRRHRGRASAVTGCHGLPRHAS